MWVNIYKSSSGIRTVGYGWGTKKEAIKLGRIDDSERLVYEKTIRVRDGLSDKEILESFNITGAESEGGVI